MLYQPLKTRIVSLEGKKSQDLDAQTGAVLVPENGSKIFIHWLTDKGQIRSTYTMTYATKIEGKVKLINGSDNPTVIQVIHLD